MAGPIATSYGQVKSCHRIRSSFKKSAAWHLTFNDTIRPSISGPLEPSWLSSTRSALFSLDPLSLTNCIESAVCSAR